jgi:hypothetical protein
MARERLIQINTKLQESLVNKIDEKARRARETRTWAVKHLIEMGMEEAERIGYIKVSIRGSPSEEGSTDTTPPAAGTSVPGSTGGGLGENLKPPPKKKRGRKSP